MRTMALLALTAASTALPASYIESNEGLLWASFKQTYNKQYAGADEASRRAIFKQNMLKGAAMEAASKTGAQFGMSPFADLTAAEFKIRHSLSFPKKASPPKIFTEAEVLKAKDGSVDWVAKGAVTQVKNQLECGSCWAFSTTGGIEGANFLAGNPLTSVSEQELVSCDTVDSGCGGGLMDNAFKWLQDSHKGAIVTEAAYPYTSGSGTAAACSWTAAMPVGATISGFADLPHDENQMATWILTNGPISIAVDATSFQTYTGGVLDTCTSQALDHGVLAVGVTPDYWVIKNSWGASWGEAGYIRVKRGSNQCLLANAPSYPTVAKVASAPKSFVQKVCTDNACTQGCQSQTFPVGPCLPVSGAGSAKVVNCASSGLTLQMFDSANCTGEAQTQTQPTSQCLADAAGTFFENLCTDAVLPAGTKLHLTL